MERKGKERRGEEEDMKMIFFFVDIHTV